jgi:hypothetical protein
MHVVTTSPSFLDTFKFKLANLRVLVPAFLSMRVPAQELQQW